ncbi:protein FAM151B [Bacillus rossius redtenbacheri]|uniref:protein FAM151B n=1 Tax=Bacillus rossius redtenbacheri TaxID=93214 RepID=UPI002FDE9750
MDAIISVLIICSVMEAVSLQKIPSVREFFPAVRNDLTKVTWAHAVNSIEKFQKALEDKVMMLEADVMIGTLIRGNDTRKDIPIMCHPEAPDAECVSDLSLDDFLARVISVNNVGIKLDFKTTEVFNKSLATLHSYKSNLTVPLWLNADILLGPVNSTGQVVDPQVFLGRSRELFPGATLSPGWKVRFGGDVTNGSYSAEHVSAMKDLLVRSNVTQPVSFPVQVGLASMSLDTLPEILEVSGVSDRTLTLWGTGADPVDVRGLRDLLRAVGRDRIYTDLPQSLLDELSSAGRRTSAGRGSLLLLLLLLAVVLSASSP